MFSKESQFPKCIISSVHLSGEREAKHDLRTRRKGSAFVESSDFRDKGRAFEKGLCVGTFLSAWLLRFREENRSGRMITKGRWRCTRVKCRVRKGALTEKGKA